MVTLARPEIDERDALLTFLDAQRGAIRRAAHGLTDAEAVSTPSASSLSLGGLVKHVARSERFWIVSTLMGRAADWPEPADWGAEHRLVEGETLAGWLKEYEQIAAETEEIVRGLASLDIDAPLPDQPWFPPNSRRSARWILNHLIAEVARHAGHADIIRETLDGKTAFELIAATKS